MPQLKRPDESRSVEAYHGFMIGRRLSEIAGLRRLILGLLSRLPLKDVTIKHHWTGDLLKLHPFLHRGYWFHGMRREHETMLCIRDLVHPRDAVFDVGGHIGYVALWLAYLASEGECHVFEPSPENLSYLQENARQRKNIRVVDKALGKSPGMFTLYLDNVGGQNTSLVSNFQGWRRTQESVGIKKMDRQTVEVEVITLDRYLHEIKTIPTFIKIDVEGFEVDVLKGSSETIERYRPALMVEAAKENKEVVWDLLMESGYTAFGETRARLSNPEQMAPNTFFIHKEDPRIQDWLA